MKPKVALIVPAFNEADRIAQVLHAANHATLVDEVIVVSDGSEDGTASVAARNGARVLCLPWNMGKGAAMAEGVATTQADLVAFVDADLLGLRGDQIDDLIRPVLEGEADMAIGLLCQGAFCSDFGNQITPGLSGQRVMRRDFFLSIPYIAELRMGVEVALTQEAHRQRLAVTRVLWDGVRNTHKEQKLGVVAGTRARLQMYSDVAVANIRVRRLSADSRRASS